MPDTDRPADLGGIDIFAGLAPEALECLLREFERRTVVTGDTLIREGEVAADLFVVLSGRFEVTRSTLEEPLAEIGPGQSVGEITFFAAGARIGTVTALRDSIVLCLTRADYDALAARLPSIREAVTTTLARRLRETSIGRSVRPDPRPRTIALIQAGSCPVDPRFLGLLQDGLARHMRTIVLDAASADAVVGRAPIDSPEATRALNALEETCACVLYLTDPEPTLWSQKAIRQADLALHVGRFDSDPAQTPLERLAGSIIPPKRTRLVLLHDDQNEVRGTRRWLAGRSIAMHHHVALDRPHDVARLVRFINGEAKGLVAGGGGAFCMAHVGLFKALQEAGYTFDMMGGTSGGSAMTAAFAAGIGPDEVDARVAESFVTRHAMHRYTVPLYGLVDHTHLDRELAKLYGDRTIEDLWIPYFAVSANLSQNRIEVHREGCLWQAIRASSSIPALLPPFYTKDGEMLVDGGLVDNVPVKVMRDLKSGPNVVMSLEAPKLTRFDVDYAGLPSRSEILRSLANPFRRRPLPRAPGIGAVLWRSMMAHRRDYERHLAPEDIHLKPPLPTDMGLLDWHRHRELFDTAYDWGRKKLAER